MFENGKVDTVTVDASASDAEVAYAIREDVELERDVAIALRKLSQDGLGLIVQEGGPVDFLVRSPEKTIAIECKANVDHISEASIERYLNAIKGEASKLLLISASSPSASAAYTLNRFTESGHLSYIDISRSDDMLEALSKAITMEFLAPRRDKQV